MNENKNGNGESGGERERGRHLWFWRNNRVSFSFTTTWSPLLKLSPVLLYLLLVSVFLTTFCNSDSDGASHLRIEIT